VSKYQFLNNVIYLDDMEVNWFMHTIQSHLLFITRNESFPC